MGKIELYLDEKTISRALKLAESRRCSLEELIKEIIERLEVSESTNDPFLGMVADEPGLMDQVIASAMISREVHPLRRSNG